MLSQFGEGYVDKPPHAALSIPPVLILKSKWFVAAVVLSNTGRVYRCAPILGYMIGWDKERVLRYARIRKWVVEEK